MFTDSLILTLNKVSFEIMITGEKGAEYRNPSKWIVSRLKRTYSTVKFINGYGINKPYFIAEFLGWDIVECNLNITYSNGHKIEIPKGTIRIFLGKVLLVGNHG